MSSIDIGISESSRKTIAEGLSRLLADTYTLYLKTHNFHWNVTGPMFQTLHLMFETQYNELWLATDLIAERIRSLGYPAPGTYAQFSKLSSITWRRPSTLRVSTCFRASAPRAKSTSRRRAKNPKTLSWTSRPASRA